VHERYDNEVILSPAAAAGTSGRLQGIHRPHPLPEKAAV